MVVWARAEPTYGENGELIDGGSDLNMGGVLSVYHDLLYLTAAAQLLSIFSRRWWYLLLLVSALLFPLFQGSYIVFLSLAVSWLYGEVLLSNLSQPVTFGKTIRNRVSSLLSGRVCLHGSSDVCERMHALWAWQR